MADDGKDTPAAGTPGPETGSSTATRRRLLKVALQEFDGRVATYLSCKGWCHEESLVWDGQKWIPADPDVQIIEYEFQAFSMDKGKAWKVQFQYPKEKRPPQEKEWADVLQGFIEAHMWYQAELEIPEETIVAAG